VSHFVGFVGSDECLRAKLAQVAGPGAVSQDISGNSLILCGKGGEPVTISPCTETGEVTIRRGDPETAGCAVTLYADRSRDLQYQADHFGQHGIFTYRGLDGTQFFASDPRLLRPIAAQGIDLAALKGYVCFSHVPRPKTLWSDIKQAETTFSEWRSPIEKSEEASDIDQMRTRLRAAVERRLTTKEVGVYLSGGLDSSLVAALLVEAGIRPRLFSLDFGPPYDAELPVAKAVAAHLGLTLEIVPARPRHIYRAVTATARALPQPFGDSVTVPLYLLGKAARDRVTEVWNGEGGDQLFGGWANKPMITALTHGGDTSEAAELREYRETYHRFWGKTDTLFTPTLRSATSDIDPADWIRPALNRDAHPTLLHRLRAANLRLKGAQNIAPRMVALAECHGLRVQAPFFDRALTEATFALPPKRLLTGACEKFLLKQVAEQYLPSDIVWRQKRGMGVPSTEWCLRQGPLGWDVRRRLSARRLRSQGWFEPELIKRLLRGEDTTAEGSFRRRRIGEKLWLLYMLEVWSEIPL
jgi:asparagine synthase (glutamine-hydrolysing)